MAKLTWGFDFGALNRRGTMPASKRGTTRRIVVMGDFSAGAAAGRLETGAALARRKLIPVEFDTLEDTLQRLQVKLVLPLGQAGSGVEVEFADLDAFHPDALYRSLDVFQSLADLRKRLNNTASFAKAAAQVQSWSGTAPSKPRKRRSRSGAPAADARLSDFARLVGVASELRTDTPVDALLRQIVGPFVQAAPDPKREAMVATVDQALSAAMREVLHQSEFQNLEALWRGLDMLLRRIETGPSLQVLLLDVSAEELAADLSSADDLSDSGLYSLLVEQRAAEKNGGISLICGLYQFEATPPHAELLGRMARIAAQAQAAFVTGMSADGMMDRRNPPHELVVESMQALREMPEASNLALLAPRFMLRHPYGKRADPISVFAFEEFTAAEGLRGMLWGHPAVLAACLLAAPSATLSIGDLPFHFVVDGDGDQVGLPCTERLVSTEIAGQWGRYGINGLMAHKGQPELRLTGLNAMNGEALSWHAAPKPAVRAVSSAPAVVEALVDDAEVVAPTQGEFVDPATHGGDDEVIATVAAAEPVDTSLDDLLASLELTDSPVCGSPEGADDGMDPELAALLKSLE